MLELVTCSSFVFLEFCLLQLDTFLGLEVRNSGEFRRDLLWLETTQVLSVVDDHAHKGY